MRIGKARFLRILLHVAALMPLVLFSWDLVHGQLTANPIREIQLRTGRYALLMLTLTLACTPVYTVTGLKEVLSFRRPLGLYAFAYASWHMLNLVGLDYRFDFPLLWVDLAEKRYIVVGFAAFLILLTLAMTSTSGWMKRLGRNWRRLHGLVYLAGVLAVIHYIWQAKVAVRTPLIYGIVIILLLLLRIPAVGRLATKYLKRRSKQ